MLIWNFIFSFLFYMLIGKNVSLKNSKCNMLFLFTACVVVEHVKVICKTQMKN